MAVKQNISNHNAVFICTYTCYNWFNLRLNTGYILGGEGSILKTKVGGGTQPVREEVRANSSFTLTPNRASSVITISATQKIAGEATISIYYTSGQQL